MAQTIQEKMLEEAYSVTPNYDIDPNDKRFTAVNEQKDAALKELDATYAGMIGQTNQYYDDQIAALDKWEDKQTEIQNAQTDFTIQQIEQQKDKAHKDYLKEQSASYVDWQKQSDQYGAKAEQLASSGLTNTGFAESSQVSMYNTYQNRVATARESYNNAVLNYNNSIKEAQLANSAALAEIAFTTLQKQLELSLAGFQYKNQLVLEQANKKAEMDNTYWNRYQDVLNQINTENALTEQIRQFNQSYDLQVKEYNESIRQFNEEIERLKKKDAQEYENEIKRLELEKQKAEEQKRQFEEEMKFKREQLEEEKRQFNKLHSKSSGGGSSSRSSSKSSSSAGAASINKSSANSGGINSQNVLSLGYGPISAQNLAGKVASGTVKATKNGNKITFSNTGKVSSSLLNKYTKYTLSNVVNKK
jgi:hypothetical protein